MDDSKKIIYAYKNNKAVYDFESDTQKSKMHVGCVSGPYCTGCSWSSDIPKCPRKEIYCNKPQHTPCPGWP